MTSTCIIESLSKNDIISIIKAAKKNGVKRLKIGDLELEISAESEDLALEPIKVVEPIRYGEDQSPTKPDELHPTIEDEAEHLMVTDPESYEKIVAFGDTNADQN